MAATGFSFWTTYFCMLILANLFECKSTLLGIGNINSKPVLKKTTVWAKLSRLIKQTESIAYPVSTTKLIKFVIVSVVNVFMW
jgi:hypothetical protein